MGHSNSFLHAGAREYVFSLSLADIRPIKLKGKILSKSFALFCSIEPELTERAGFEPAVQVYARTTV